MTGNNRKCGYVHERSDLTKLRGFKCDNEWAEGRLTDMNQIKDQGKLTAGHTEPRQWIIAGYGIHNDPLSVQFQNINIHLKHVPTGNLSGSDK
jgi:hypothetical protein